MEGCVPRDLPPHNMESCNLDETTSAVNFQKFVYDLFEKNGILNDLRAYLRGHIVDVLKSAQTGQPPSCQKHFTQRLELSYQALNMLVAEYLLRLEFSYSLSVFVSEIPLANMVFGFAKKLMQTISGDLDKLKFKEGDVWSILNYLGIKCDSEHATNIFEMYNQQDAPLLFCILKCIPMYQDSNTIIQGNLSSASLSSSMKSLDSMDREKRTRGASKIPSTYDKCRHCIFCKTCQAKMRRIKEKYRVKKKNLTKKVRQTDMNPLNVGILMRNIGVVEQSIVDEMFQQLKNVYEAEVDMMRQDEEKKIKRTIASHALQLQKQRDEMEESFKAREVELEHNVQEKKKFLWGLARALREQHAQMSRAMQAVKQETERLTAKEDSLKSQLIEAEEILRRRGEDMRKQISEELIVIEGHLASMKKERDNISKERSELENLKTACQSNSHVLKVHDLTSEELRSHYDLLKDEFSILKKYLETTKLEPKCVMERSTLTEMNEVTSKTNMLNNETAERSSLKNDSEDRLKTPNKVINDLKKQKNVNFCTSNVDEIFRESRSHSHSRSSLSSEGDPRTSGAARRDAIQQLAEENERLKAFARQQREHIDELTSHQARLHSLTLAGSRPRTAPDARRLHCAPQGVIQTASSNTVGWRKGAGEEISIFANAQPRILLPGDALPFVGTLRDRNVDNRRHLINQWRALRRRMSPIGVVGKSRPAPVAYRDKSPRERPATAIPTIDPPASGTVDLETISQINETLIFPSCTRERPKTALVAEKQQPHRDKSPKSVLREAKEKLRNRCNTREHTARPSTTREKSPNSVLREAKLRLRKLEIEAEAVEKSYLDFRRRQTELKQNRNYSLPDQPIDQDTFSILDKMNLRSRSQHNILNEDYKLDDIPDFNFTEIRDSMKKDFDSYLCEYTTKFNISSTYCHKNVTINDKTQPIPSAFSKVVSDRKKTAEENYLETPLNEFRKLYHSDKSPERQNQPPERQDQPENTKEKESKDYLDIVVKNDSNEISSKDSSESRSKSIRNKVKSKQDELEILKNNISKMYNLQDQDKIDEKVESTIEKIETKNNSEPNSNTIDEIQNVSEKNNSEPKRDLLLVVESTIETREITISDVETEKEKISTHMTIIVSPKRSLPKENIDSPSHRSERSVSPEQAARLTRNDVLNAIFHAENAKANSSIEMELKISQDSITDYDKGAEDYPDDFSADVDNYNSRSDYGNNSPISLPKNSEDDNFWDS